MRYNTFHMIAGVFVVLAWVMGIGTFLLCLGLGIWDGDASSVILLLFIGVVGGFFQFVSLYAFAQFIYIAIDIERNTRATVRALLEEVVPEEEMEEKE